MALAKAMKAATTASKAAGSKGTRKATTKAMTKGSLTNELALRIGLKRTEVRKLVSELATIGTEQVKSAGKFTLPGLCTIKKRTKPATAAGTRKIFGKEMKVAAKPARDVVKAFPVAGLRKSI